MKKLLIFFVTITWILYSAVSCIANDFCTSSMGLDSGSVSIKSDNNEVKSGCTNTDTESVISDSSDKRRYKYGSDVYVSDELRKIHLENGDYSITRN